MRYYFVSFIAQNADMKSTHHTGNVLIKVPYDYFSLSQTQKFIEEKYEHDKVVITNFIKITKKEYESK